MPMSYPLDSPPLYQVFPNADSNEQRTKKWTFGIAGLSSLFALGLLLWTYQLCRLDYVIPHLIMDILYCAIQFSSCSLVRFLTAMGCYSISLLMLFRYVTFGIELPDMGVSEMESNVLQTSIFICEVLLFSLAVRDVHVRILKTKQ